MPLIGMELLAEQEMKMKVRQGEKVIIKPLQSN